MSSMLPIWLLPLWTLGVPLILAIIELVRLPNSERRGSVTAQRVG